MSDFNPEMLLLLRDAERMTQEEVADAIGVSQGRMSKIENGSAAADAELVQRLAKLFRVEPPFFSRSDVRRGMPVGFYRKRATIPGRDLAELEAQLNLLKMDLARLARSVEMHAPFRRPTIDPYVLEAARPGFEVAAQVRAALRLPTGPIRNMMDVVESMGVVVVPMRSVTRKWDAISWSGIDGAPDVIVYNEQAPTDRLRRSLSHEVGHLCMHASSPRERMEDEADDFASEFLMPANEIDRSLTGSLTMERLYQLKLYWKVSMGSIIQRAAELGKITQNQQRWLWQKMSVSGYRTAEPGTLPQEAPHLLNDMIGAHLDGLGYSLEELAGLLDLPVDRMAVRYPCVGASGLRLVT